MTLQQSLQLACASCGTEIGLMATEGIDLIAMARLEGWRDDSARRPGADRIRALPGDSAAGISLRWFCPTCRTLSKDAR